MSIRLQEIVIDCNDLPVVAEFWARLLDRPWAMVFEPDWAVVDLGGGLHIGLQRVPETKQSPKNRLHLDLIVDDLQASSERARDLGAISIEELIDRADGTGFVVMQDVEGNEFCLVRDRNSVYDRAVDDALRGANGRS